MFGSEIRKTLCGVPQVLHQSRKDFCVDGENERCLLPVVKGSQSDLSP